MLLTSPVNHAVMLHSRYLDEVLEYDKRRFLERGRLHPGALRSYIRALRAHRFDLVIAPATVSVSFSTDLLCRLTGAPVRIGAGVLNGVPNDSASLYTHPVSLDWRATPDRHQTLRNFDVAAGLPGLMMPEDLRSDITFTEAERRAGEEQAAALRGGRRLLIAVHPGAGKDPNRWPAGRFAEAADRLAAAHDAALVITAGPMDEEPVRRVRANLRTPHAVLERRPIREVAAVLARADLLISNDTGVMHVGAAAGTRVLSLFGPTPPEQWAPAGPGHWWLRGAGGDITAITVEEVIRAAGEMGLILRRQMP
jgi:ADP-heptose:LPS heptosyltransferase